MSETGDRITRIYGSFRGVDFRGGDDINLSRSPDCLNVWKDYKKGDGITTRPGLSHIDKHGSTIYGIYFYEGIMIVHSGSYISIYEDAGEPPTTIYSKAAERPSNAFVYNGKWYFMDGESFLEYDIQSGKMVSVADKAFVPTTMTRYEENSAESYQEVNLLTPICKNVFVTKDTEVPDRTFQLDAENIDSIISVVYNGREYPFNELSIDLEKGTVALDDDPEPNTEYTITFARFSEAEAEKRRRQILGCTLLQVFDNRIFVSGNPDYPNTVWHCALNDPTYFSDLDYYREGMDSAEIRSLVVGNNGLWVFREPSDANTSVFYHNPVQDDELGKIYPSQHSSISTGCTGRAINFNDDIVFFSPRGMEGISKSDITSEQFIAHRSSMVDERLLNERVDELDGPDTKQYEDMILAEHNGYLFVFIGRHVYLADSRAVFNHEGHAEYEWYYWELDKTVTCAKEEGGRLYIGTLDGYVYSLEAGASGIESYWVTPRDKFKAPNKQKTSNKRGCVVEAEGDVSVAVKTDATEFENVAAFKGVKDSFVCRIKRKKWKDIQLKFYSNTRFSLNSATLEAFVGGYIKR